MNDLSEILILIRKRREQLGISLEDLHNTTKIRLQVLKQIDECDISNIEPIYAVSFIRTICSHLKFKSTEIDEFIENLNLVKKQKDYQSNVYTQKVDFTKSVFQNQGTVFSNLKNFLDVKYLNYSIYFFIFLLVIAIIYFSFFSNNSPKDSNLSTKIDTLKIENKTDNLASHFISDSIILEARGIDTAWLRLQIDGKHSEQIVMVPKMERQWTATKYIQLSVGNGGAIEFKRNGKLLEPFGAKGSVVRNVKITSTEIIVSSSPWTNNNESPEVNVTKKPKKKKEEVKPEPQKPKRLGESNINTPPIQIKK